MRVIHDRSGARVFTAVLLAVCSLSVACTRGTPLWFQPPARVVEVERVRFSYLSTADLRAGDQLGPGWYEIENGAWRWMGRKATLFLKRPESTNIVLEAKLYLPPNLIERLGAPSLIILLDGEWLATRTFPQAGEYVLRERVPRGRLRTATVRLDMKLDRALPPTGPELRELGAVVTAIGFRWASD